MAGKPSWHRVLRRKESFSLLGGEMLKTVEIKLDCLGDMCPLPVIKAGKELARLSAEDSLLIVTDHSCVKRSLVEKLAAGNYSIEEDEVMNGIWEIRVRKKR